MAATHTVQQGEYLAMIAKNYGFASYKTIWEHDSNAELREKRQNPNILLPGDQVFIPDKETKESSISAGRSSRFRVRQDKVKLRLVIQELYGKPIANAQCEVRVDDIVKNAVTQDDGTIEIEIPASAKSAELIVRQDGSQFDGMTIPIKIGHLDPVEEETGQIARLNNLGYFAGPTDEIDEKLFASAVEEFQCDHPKLAVDGVCGTATQAKLKEIHGS